MVEPFFILRLGKTRQVPRRAIWRAFAVRFSSLPAILSAAGVLAAGKYALDAPLMCI
ncbi:hypothetical protein [Billgrantia endophytica]|uniref:hypothetical protein n=1 Tax=Billgrantia endophytica TaxID=2033802 RepID=UPI0013FD1618|nr:hypothetical protein [Halomonas endophytica]